MGVKKRVIIMGAAGRDFHNFNVYFRDNDYYQVVAFTAAQIPGISGRIYPPELAGRNYPEGIPVYPEDMLEELIKEKDVDFVVLAYSDLTHEDVMHKASRVIAAGASFILLGPKHTMLKSPIPVIAVTAVRTGAGKSTVTRRIASILKKYDVRFNVVRHPMPYSKVLKYPVQRFSSFEDLDRYECTIEEREEYEPHIEMGNVVYAGVDYGKVLEEASKNVDVIIWDGGNNDFPFFKPTLMITVADALRPYQEISTYPGEANVRMADVVLINKVNSAKPEDVKIIEENVRKLNSRATIIKASSRLHVSDPDLIKDKRVLVIEDGPTVTHGGMSYSIGYVAAVKYGAREIVDPRRFAVGSLMEVYEQYTHIGPVLPAMGYNPQQIKDLNETIQRIDYDVIVSGTPIDLSRILKLSKPYVKVRYELEEISKPDLEDVLRTAGVLRG
ncbi:MAG: cyclic 2,3-diphosphoglycerate synthase [Aigarchaeota archaeon]|nr:cyclic 2,3-diphosphoglycerate synthase [Candidatus Geocrenenecus dongiae]